MSLSRRRTSTPRLLALINVQGLDTAKELGISERKFVNFLIDEKYLYRTPAKQLRPYAKKSNEGLFETKDWYTKSDIVSVRVLFTPQGKQFFHKKLVEKGFIGAPMVCA